MIKIFPDTLGELSLLFLLSFDPLPTSLTLPSPQSCVQNRRCWCSPVVCKNDSTPINAAARRNRPGAPFRKLSHCVHARPRRRPQRAGESPRRVPRANSARHPALHIPLSISRSPYPALHIPLSVPAHGAPVRSEQRSAHRIRALRTAQRS